MDIIPTAHELDAHCVYLNDLTLICYHLPILLCDQAFLDDEMLTEGTLLTTLSMN